MIGKAIGSTDAVQIEAARKQIEAEALAEMNASQTVVDVEAVLVGVEDHSSAGSLVA